MQQIAAGLQHELELLVRRAGEHILQLWPGKRGGSDHLRVETKPDNSIVTSADYESNQIIVEGLKRLFPQHKIVSEEGPCEATDLSSSPTWVIDPIDGTTYFFEGKEYFRVLLGLLDRGEVELGIMYFPATQQFYFAQRRQGCYLNGRLLNVSKQADWSKAAIFLNHLSVAQPGCARWTSGDTGLVCADLCSQKLDAGVVRITGHKTWDLLPYIIMTEECGGCVSDEKGQPARFEKEVPGMRFLAFSNTLLHAPLLNALQKWQAAL